MQRRHVLFLAIAALAGTRSSDLLAHAHLQHAEPASGSTLSRSPDRVSLRFSEAIELAFSRVRVIDAAGEQVDRRDAGAVDGDRQAIAVSLPELPPGGYEVRWIVVSVDSHRTEGRYTFTVAGG